MEFKVKLLRGAAQTLADEWRHEVVPQAEHLLALSTVKCAQHPLLHLILSHIPQSRLHSQF